ncbi:AAA family ATPase [Streptacidiphilus fuscans]|uniref:AAA family ATPase n=1 Tax=Streptacidiphilus fuscans TaxID=2789292 RepID=A0A931BBK7_9ACTN|nr:LuxR family transcriptional regulator [Streptacidiphilus fuscans]MBF9072616.1 AAA family ATPase [Streptacidiphilus fuscans]
MRRLDAAAATVSREDVLDSAVRALHEAPGLVLLGAAGIGRSHLAERLVEQALADGVRVLRCAPVEAELPLPFMCLIDLLDSVSDETLEALPTGQRDALRAALLRGGDEDVDPAGARVPLAVLTLLRRLAAEGPVWLVVDDVQWVDEPTARVLSFVARRCAGTALRIVATEQTGCGRMPVHDMLCPEGVVRLTVPPMTPAEVTALLTEHAEHADHTERAGHAGVPLPSGAVQQIVDTVAGNPRYALELLRALPPDGRPEAADFGGAARTPLRGLLLDRLHALPQEVRAALVLVAAATRPDLTLLATAGGPSVTLRLEAAERLGEIRIGPDGHVHFDNPLLRSAVYTEASGHERRNAHARLAEAVIEPVERARHLALANPARDEGVAQTLTVAAAAARRRGAPGTAAELAALAVVRTPADAETARTERQLAAAGYAVDAGRLDVARAEAQVLIAEARSPEARSQARIVLLRCAGQSLEHEGALIRDGLSDAAAARSPGLEARLRCWSASRDLLAGRVHRAEAEARRAARLAAEAALWETELEALTTLAYLQRLGGDPEAETTLRRALANARGRGIDELALGEALRTEAVFHLHANRLAAAERSLLGMLARLGERLGVEEQVSLQIHLADVRISSGDCRGALQAARRARELHADLVGTDAVHALGREAVGREALGRAAVGRAGVGREAVGRELMGREVLGRGVVGQEVAHEPDAAGPVLYITAAAESVGGSLDRARLLAQRGAHRAARDGDRFWRLWNLTVLGRVQLMAGRAAQAAEVLREARVIEREMGIVDPGIGRWHADLAEALVAEGTESALAEAGEFVDEVSAVARRLGREAVLGTMERAAALLRLARGETPEAAGLLESAVARLRPQGVPLELARALSALAEAERRGRRHTASRRAADEALQIFQDAGAAAWLAVGEPHAQGAALPPPVPRQAAAHPAVSSPLTPSEQRIAALAAAGATNREIAADCYLSVKTVEASLSRVYRKVGVRSRTELASRTELVAQPLPG